MPARSIAACLVCLLAAATLGTAFAGPDMMGGGKTMFEMVMPKEQMMLMTSDEMATMVRNQMAVMIYKKTMNKLMKLMTMEQLNMIADKTSMGTKDQMIASVDKTMMTMTPEQLSAMLDKTMSIMNKEQMSMLMLENNDAMMKDKPGK